MKSLAHGLPPTSVRGFTLLELMVVVAIVGILAAIAYPSYINSVNKSRRADGKEALLRVQLEEEKWRANNAAYTETLGSGGLGLSSSSEQGYYSIAITGGSASGTGYIATATAKGAQLADKSCPTLTLTLSATGESKTPSSCW